MRYRLRITTKDKKMAEQKAYKDYAMTQDEVAEKLFLHPKSILDIEKRALAKLRVIMEQRGLTAKDLLIE
jgi:DNA-binding XRE family transcriptional regulator